MNNKLIAYLLKHGRFFEINGQQELMLPVDRTHGFLDLIQLGDIPPDRLHYVYALQAQCLQLARKQAPRADAKE